ncbi:MAG TPA: hypothetical protein VM915_01135 [Verrucomicrobiae bacterium]|nr:hypothetical protein [Verrucomicrobiae bacterium]
MSEPIYTKEKPTDSDCVVIVLNERGQAQTLVVRKDGKDQPSSTMLSNFEIEHTLRLAAERQRAIGFQT